MINDFWDNSYLMYLWSLLDYTWQYIDEFQPLFHLKLYKKLS